jgi:hypothetical protein
MPKFAVDVTRTLELSTTITVTAPTEEAAKAHAAHLASETTLTWESDGTVAWETLVDVVSVEHVKQG